MTNVSHEDRLLLKRIERLEGAAGIGDGSELARLEVEREDRDAERKPERR